MPFCPKCKLEYVDSIKECTDCKCELVDKLTEFTQKKAVYFDESEEYMDKLVDYLLYSKIYPVEQDFDSETNSYCIYVNATDEKKAKRLLNTYFEHELDDESQLTSDKIDELYEPPEVVPYVKPAAKYQDLKSTGIVLFIAGIGGDIYLILTFLGLIGSTSGSVTDIMYYIVMGTLFNVFLISGISSIKKSKKVQNEINLDEQKTKEILDFVKNNYTKDSIDKECSFSASSEEGKFFERSEFIKKIITERFGEQNSSYMDEIIEQLYSSIYE